MKNTFSLAKLVLPGLVLAILIASLTTLLCRSLSHSSNFYLDPMFIGLLLGILVRWLLGDKFILWPGFGFTQDFFMPLGILLYATQVRWNVFSSPSVQRFFLPAVLALLIYYLFLVWPAKRLNVRREAALLIWASCALLGPIAVVLLTPMLRTTDEETSLSLILAAFATNLMLILLPIIYQLYPFSLSTIGALSTLTLPLLSPVNPITSGLPEAIVPATLLFGLKVGLLGPLALAVYFANKSTATTGEKLPLMITFIFILLGISFTVFPQLTDYSKAIYPYSQFTLTLAIVGVGLSTNLRALVLKGNKAARTYLILASGASLTVFLAVLLALRYLMGGL